MNLLGSPSTLFGVLSFALTVSAGSFVQEDTLNSFILQQLKQQGQVLENIQQQCFGREVSHVERSAPVQAPPVQSTIAGMECIFVDTRSRYAGIRKAVSVNMHCDKLENVAPGKATSSSSIHSGKYDTPQAIDDDEDSMFHSATEPYPWWMIDLGTRKTVYAVTLLTRQSCCYGRLHDVEIRLGNTYDTNGAFGSHKLLTFYKGPYRLKEGTLMYTFPNGVIGRYLSIKIDKPGDQILQINDVKIFALKN